MENKIVFVVYCNYYAGGSAPAEFDGIVGVFDNYLAADAAKDKYTNSETNAFVVEVLLNETCDPVS